MLWRNVFSFLWPTLFLLKWLLHDEFDLHKMKTNPNFKVVFLSECATERKAEKNKKREEKKMCLKTRIAVLFVLEVSDAYK